MADHTQQQVRQMIDQVLAGLAADVFEDDYEYYNSLYPDDTDEYDLANGVLDYPELRPQAVRVVETLIDRLDGGDAFSIWVNDEVQAGSPLTCALAMNDKQYCNLFARMLEQQDLDHEVEQNDDIRRIIDKWGICPETLRILEARVSNPGQWGIELLEELQEEGLLDGTDFEIPDLD